MTLAVACVGVALIGAGACLPGGGPEISSQFDAEAPPPTSLGDDAGPSAADVDLGDPFAIVGLVPSHGPWTGGTRAKLAGRGFSSKLRVWIGGTELAPSAIFASDPTRAAIETPPGAPGPADVRIRDDASAQERTLAAGFLYDAFVVQPDSGATTGGTRIALVGSGTAWKAGTTIAIGGAACSDVAVADATHMECTTPPGSPGSKDVTVTTPDGAFAQARDAYTYSDSPDGYRGGLAGGALNGAMRVLAFDAWTGTAIPGAHVIAGSTLATAITKSTDSAGLALLNDPSLTGKITVTVAAKCHQPTSFVDVPVDTVTAYLTPTLDPSCAQGDPPSTGGHGGQSAGEIDGELIFPGIEFKPGDWTVPEPTKSTERRAAYVFTASGSPQAAFNLPPKELATTPSSGGSHGYAYATIAAPGNTTLYALAGIEDRSVTPPRFVAYVMGVARGVSSQPGVKTLGVDIPMTTMLDHRLVLTPVPPPIGARGPDRLVAQMAVTVGQGSFAILPMATASALLPMTGDLSFVGVPALDGTLSGEAYNLGASAVTGANGGVPASVVARIVTNDTNDPVTISGFLPVPVLHEPASGAWGGTHVSFEAAGAVDLVELSVTSGSGLVSWTIVAPAGATSFDLPDLATMPGAGLVRGTITTTVYSARVNGFAYGKLRYGQLGAGAWNAYAFDTQSGAY
jgi:hypothetical protein